MRFERLNNLLAKRGGDLAILFFSLLLAFFMWSMHRMTGKYSAVVDYKIELNSNIEGRAQSSLSRNSLILRGKSSGFFIFQQRYINNTLPLFIDAKQLKPLGSEKDIFYIQSSNIQNMVQEVLGNDFQMENVISDTLYFQFPKQSNKKVPVVATENISFELQYVAKGNMVLRPDSVVIYGNEDVIRDIDSVYTKFISINKVKAPVQGVVELQPINGVRFSDEDIYYSQDVVRYFESSVVVKPVVINVPLGNRAIVVPHEVTLYYRMPFDAKQEVEANEFVVVINYKTMGNSNMVKPAVVRSPENVFDIRLEPKFIECIIN